MGKNLVNVKEDMEIIISHLVEDEENNCLEKMYYLGEKNGCTYIMENKIDYLTNKKFNKIGIVDTTKKKPYSFQVIELLNRYNRK